MILNRNELHCLSINKRIHDLNIYSITQQHNNFFSHQSFNVIAAYQKAMFNGATVIYLFFWLGEIVISAYIPQ